MFVITGGGSGIGRALAWSLADRGQSVTVIGRREQALKETVMHSPLIQSFCADVATSQGLDKIAEELARFSSIDALVNNAGTLDPITSIKDITSSNWEQCLKVNLDAALFLPQKLQAQLAHGRVLNIGSGAAYFPVQGMAAYCVSKAGLSMLTRCWQLESDLIAFAHVMPGICDTKMQSMIRDATEMDPEKVSFYQQLKDTHRLITPSTVAAFLTWLLLDIDCEKFASQEWDIYETIHHSAWLRPPHQVIHWED